MKKQVKNKEEKMNILAFLLLHPPKKAVNFQPISVGKKECGCCKKNLELSKFYFRSYSGKHEGTCKACRLIKEKARQKNKVQP